MVQKVCNIQTVHWLFCHIFEGYHFQSYFGLNNILFNKSQDMLWKYIVEIGSDIKLWGFLWSFPNTFESFNIYEWYK